MPGRDIVDDLADQHAELAALLAGLTPADWHRPSPCEGWSAADVVLHLAQSDELAVGSLQGRFDDALGALTAGLAAVADVDDGADAMVRRDRSLTPAERRARWERGAPRLVALLRATDPHARVRWVAGEMSARTLATTRLAETWIHAGDVAAAVGRRLTPTSRLEPIVRLAWRTLPYAFANAGRALSGPVQFELTGPSGERWTFAPDEPPRTIVRGAALELCGVAARRVDPRETSLVAEGPDGDAVLDLVRTYA